MFCTGACFSKLWLDLQMKAKVRTLPLWEKETKEMKFPLSFQVFFSTNISFSASLNKWARSKSEDLWQCSTQLCTFLFSLSLQFLFVRWLYVKMDRVLVRSLISLWMRMRSYRLVLQSVEFQVPAPPTKLQPCPAHSKWHQIRPKKCIDTKNDFLQPFLATPAGQTTQCRFLVLPRWRPS